VSALAFAACGKPSRPHIVWIVIDAQRAGSLGAYGYRRDTSPVLDALASEGVLFELAMSQESYTQASVPSYFTSTYPLTHQVLYNNPDIDVLDESFVTIAEILRDDGYQTAAFVFNPHLKARFGFNQGFELYDDDKEGWKKGIPHYINYETASKIHEKTARYLEDTTQDPIFLYLHYRDVHDPYVPPPPYHKRFLPRGYEPVVDILYPEEGHLPLHENVRLARSQYDGEILYTDFYIGKTLNLLAEHGLTRDNTVFVVTADHGEEFFDRHPGDRGGSFHGRTLYREQIHVPLIFSFPGLEPKKRRLTSAVALVDIVPTLLDYIGIDPGRFDFQGQSLLPMIREGREREGFVYSGGNHNRGAIISGKWKFYRNDRQLKRNRRRNFTRPEADQTYEFVDELYDIETDPAETNNLIDEYPEVARLLEEQLKQITNELTKGKKPSNSVGLDDETKRQLEALGYVDAGADKSKKRD
jgi:arylsulfatase A-like enzyme